MWEKFLKKSGWTDIAISLIFILLGVMLIARPESIMSVIAILLGAIFIIMGILKGVDYWSSGRQDKYSFATAVILIIIGIVVMFCADLILSAFRILIGIWIIYTGIMNLQTTIVWRNYHSKLWILSIILAIILVIAGIFIIINSGSILQTIGIAILIYGIVNIIENIIFIKKIDNYLE